MPSPYLPSITKQVHSLPCMLPFSFRKSIWSKGKTTVTKKIPAPVIASTHPSPSFRCYTNARHIFGGLSNDIGIGCAYTEHSEQHQRTGSLLAYLSRTYIRASLSDHHGTGCVRARMPGKLSIPSRFEEFQHCTTHIE